jgi:hypothetical protein
VGVVSVRVGNRVDAATDEADTASVGGGDGDDDNGG